MRTTWASPVPGRSGPHYEGEVVVEADAFFEAKSSVGVNVDAVAVRVDNLDTGEAAFILPFGFGDASFAQPITRASNLVRVRHLKTEVVGVRSLLRHSALAQGEQVSLARTKNEKVLVVMHSFVEAEMHSIERR